MEVSNLGAVSSEREARPSSGNVSHPPPRFERVSSHEARTVPPTHLLKDRPSTKPPPRPDDAKVHAFLARLEDKKAHDRRQLEREQRQRDMGIGYLVWVAREHGRLSQRDLARRIGSSRTAISRWESGRQIPSVRSLQKVSAAAGLELMIGCRDPNARDHDIVAIGVSEEEGNLTELRMLRDYKNGKTWLRPTGWRERMGDLAKGIEM